MFAILRTIFLRIRFIRISRLECAKLKSRDSGKRIACFDSCQLINHKRDTQNHSSSYGNGYSLNFQGIGIRTEVGTESHVTTNLFCRSMGYNIL